jgi:hypothetical protein
MPPRINKGEIEAILNQKNLLVRNLQITQGYHEVFRSLRSLVSTQNINWFGFGTYASKTAGRAIRHETLPGALKSALIRSAGFENTYMYLHQVLEHANQDDQDSAHNLLAKVLSRVSLLLSQGNLLIFQELAWPFTSMVENFRKDWAINEEKWASFLDAHLRPGPIEQGGQGWLREAFTAFYQARFQTDGKRKAELVFLGNLLVGLHEQTHLQPIIEEAVAVPFDTFTEGLIPEDEAELKRLRMRIRRRYVGFTRQMVLRTITRMFMTYSLPTRDMRVGESVVAPTGLTNYPPNLQQIENPRCREILQQFHREEDTLSGSAAGNWSKLEDRMTFIIDFFRSYQQYKPLSQPPFLENQVPVIKSGGFPGGPL